MTDAPPVEPHLGQFAEFARLRFSVYFIQDQLFREKAREQQQYDLRANLDTRLQKLQREIERLQEEDLRLLEDIRQGDERRALLVTRLTCQMEDMQFFLNQEQQTIRIYSDMSLSSYGAAFGGLVLENGGMTTMSGTIAPGDTNVCEAMAMCEVVEWAAKRWPHALLEVFSDSVIAVESAEVFVRMVRMNSTLQTNNKIKINLHKLFHQRLGPYRHRLFPRWISRNSLEIRICDALARSQAGLAPHRLPWLRLLDLTQGGVRGVWSSAAVWTLHKYHRASRKGHRLSWDRRTSNPPA